MANEVQKLRNLCRKWGGDLLKVSKEEYKELGEEGSPTFGKFHQAPFTDSSLGLHWPSRTIVYAGPPLWWEIVHEMGHAFASRESPGEADELSYLGWEYQLAKSLGGVRVWLAHNKDYGIEFEDAYVLGNLPPKQRRIFFKERIAASKEAGLLDENLRPISLPRKVDIEWSLKTLRERSEESRNHLRQLQSANVRDGNQFQLRCEIAGFVRGYDHAVSQVEDILISMTVSPFPRASLKV